MKKYLSYLFVATGLLLGMSAIFTSCSDDDDNNDNQQALGDKAVLRLQNLLLDEDNNPVFGEANEQGIYQMGFDEEEDATKLVGTYVNNSQYAGGQKTYTLPDARGTVKVTEGAEEGIYYEVQFAVKGITPNPMTLQLVEPNYMDGENRLKTKTSYKCNNCEFIFKLFNLAVKKCTSCGSTDIEKVD